MVTEQETSSELNTFDPRYQTHLLTAGHFSIRVYDLEFMSEVLKVEAHDSEILGLDFSHSLPGC